MMLLPGWKTNRALISREKTSIKKIESYTVGWLVLNLKDVSSQVAQLGQKLNKSGEIHSHGMTQWMGMDLPCIVTDVSPVWHIYDRNNSLFDLICQQCKNPQQDVNKGQ